MLGNVRIDFEAVRFAELSQFREALVKNIGKPGFGPMRSGASLLTTIHATSTSRNSVHLYKKKILIFHGFCIRG